VALLAGPAAYSVSAATTASSNGTNPTAGPGTGGGMGGGAQGGGAQGGGAPKGNFARRQGSSTSGPPTGTKGNAPSQSGRSAGGMGGQEVTSAMITYLKKHQDGATWLVAVATDQTASSIILESGQPVISMGGWSGSDDAMTLARLKGLVSSGELHYIVVGSGGGGQGTDSEIATWVEQHGTAVGTCSGLYRLDASNVG
jgi:hypothetical protein